jgi:hypothetical protein
MNIIKKHTILTALILSLTGLAQPSLAYELWKGNTEVRPIEVGLLTGLSLYGTSANWSVLGTGAYLLKDKGLIDEIDDRVWVEVEMGPAFFSTGASSQTGLQYSTHVRWDFTFNEYWNFYSLGGLSGFLLPKYYNSSFTIHPRFGVGAQYQTKTALMFRGEISAEFMGFGVAFNF